MTLKSKEAGRQIQEQSFESSMAPAGRKPIAREKKKDINIKVTRNVHGRVKKLLFHQPPEWSDDPAMDLGDCFEKVLDFWEEHHQND
jgi:hypothetical protein